MTKTTKFGQELIASLEGGLAILRGEKEAARVHLPPDWPDVRAIREGRADTGGIRARYGLKVAAVRDWEQGLRRPDPAARTLLRVIEKEQAAVERVLAAE